MEKVRLWCGQHSDRGRPKNRTDCLSLLLDRMAMRSIRCGLLLPMWRGLFACLSVDYAGELRLGYSAKLGCHLFARPLLVSANSLILYYVVNLLSILQWCIFLIIARFPLCFS